MFIDEKFSNSSQYYYLRPGVCPSVTDIVEAMNTLIEERHNHSESCVNVKKFRETQKTDFYIATERSGLAFCSTDLGQIFGAMLAINLEWCWEEKVLTNQKLLPTLFAYTLSWFTRTWLSTITLMSFKLCCCAAFLSFESWRHYSYWILHRLSDP